MRYFLRVFLPKLFMPVCVCGTILACCYMVTECAKEPNTLCNQHGQALVSQGCR